MEPLRIVAATNNANKVLELQTVAKSFPIEILSPVELASKLGLGETPDVLEDADTYRGNALLKARAFSQWSGLAALGDDSGLEVAALDNRPGLHSARYAGEGASDSDRIDKLLAELAELKASDRSAAFHCSLSYVDPSGMELFADGSLQGEVLEQRRGDAGFGYDPIIFLPSIGSTLAEVDFSVTCEHGFRAIAAKKMFNQLVQSTMKA